MLKEFPMDIKNKNKRNLHQQIPRISLRVFQQWKRYQYTSQTQRTENREAIMNVVPDDTIINLTPETTATPNSAII